MLDDETSYRLLKLIHENPAYSQRQLAEEMGISLGKANYCIKALIKIGLIKMQNFAKSSNKIGYAYILTPKGATEKTKVTKRFLARKLDEYEALKQEIANLKLDAGESWAIKRNRRSAHTIPVSRTLNPVTYVLPITFVLPVTRNLCLTCILSLNMQFKSLTVWQKVVDLSCELYGITKSLNDYSFRDQ